MNEGTTDASLNDPALARLIGRITDTLAPDAI
jgi:hypothetical protein